MELKEMIDLGLSVVVAVTAIIAVFQTIYQLKRSNKQFLFDRRLKIYSIITSLLKLYEANANVLDISISSGKDDEIDVDILFYGLTNNSYFCEIQNIINHPLEQPYQKNFLTKLDEFDILISEIQFIYKENNTLSNFMSNYKLVLNEMYKYKISQIDMVRCSKNISKLQIKEKNRREVLLKRYSDLKKSYDALVNDKAMNKIKKEII